MAAMLREINRRLNFKVSMHRCITVYETVEKEVQDTSCRRSGVSTGFRSPQDWGIRGLIESISAISLGEIDTP
jgi:hypothetical protein